MYGKQKGVLHMNWRFLQKSIKGYSHHQNRLPNQDASALSYDSVDIFPAILAVSDGHGSPSCFRSHIGANLAVESAAELLTEWQEGGKTGVDTAVSDLFHHTLPQQVVQLWKRKIDRHIYLYPFTSEEQSILDRRRKKDAGLHYLAYGATLLAAALTADYAAILQIGDGEIVLVNEQLETSHPLQPQNLLGNETPSLCTPNAASYFQTTFTWFTNPIPRMLLLSTDGYSNAFKDQAGFDLACKDIAALLQTQGDTYVKEHLGDWLREASREGSGDDCTLAIAYRFE